MKIGILTWFFANNYGARAHTYALRKIIEEIGYDCEFVNYIPPKAYKIDFRNSINCQNPKCHPLLMFRCFKRCYEFWKYKRLNPVGVRVKSADDINLQKYDLIFIGSDAIMNINHPLFSKVYYGVGIDSPHATYAPSAEYMTLDDARNCSELAKGLNSAIALSARDENTKQILMSLTDLNVENVLDPTFLWDFKDIQIVPKESNYILVYSFSDWDNLSKQMINYAKEYGYKIISVGRYCKWANVSYDYASFPQWLGFFVNARLIFTDSFHGVCFGLKNEKQIVFTSRNDKIAKIKDLLYSVGACNIEFYDGNKSIDEYLETNRLDYEIINLSINEKKQKSIDYLINTIKKVEN